MISYIFKNSFYHKGNVDYNTVNKFEMCSPRPMFYKANLGDMACLMQRIVLWITKILWTALHYVKLFFIFKSQDIKVSLLSLISRNSSFLFLNLVCTKPSKLHLLPRHKSVTLNILKPFNIVSLWNGGILIENLIKLQIWSTSRR